MSIAEAIMNHIDSTSEDNIPPIPSAAPSNDVGETKEQKAKRLKAERDKRYRENKAKGKPSAEKAVTKAKPAKASKPKAKPAKGKATKAAPKPKAKPKAKSKPAAKGKGSKVKDARTMPRSERPDTDAIILGLIARKPKTARELHESGKLSYLKLSGVSEALKRLFRNGKTTAHATEREGRDGRPAFAYQAK